MTSHRTLHRTWPLLLALTTLAPPALSQNAVAIEVDHWSRPPGSNDQFGWTIALDNYTALVGSSFGDGATTDSGTATVFVRRNSEWTRQAVLQADDGQFLDYFGSSVAISGNLAVAGAPGLYADGQAYVFERSGTTWTQVQKLTPASGGAFGWAVAADGARIAVGAPRGSTSGAVGSGAAYVYAKTGGSWTVESRLFALDPTDSAALGDTLVLKGDTLFVGAINADETVDDQGAVYVFERSGSDWAQSAKLTAPGGATGDFFGSALAASRDTLVVGAYWADGTHANQGAVHVFERSGTTWVHTALLTASDPVPEDRFGYAVALDGDLLLVGTPENPYGSHSIGRAYVFQRDANGDWNEELQLEPSLPSTNEAFGSAVALDGRSALIGAPRPSPPGPGSVSVYDTGAVIGTSYCDPAQPNTTGLPATLVVAGSEHVDDDHLILVAGQMPPYPGYFLMGAGTNIFTPPGSVGRLCISPNIRRFVPAQTPDTAGGGYHRVTGTGGPVSSAIVPGSTWNFQAWYSDLPGRNFTNAVSVTFH